MIESSFRTFNLSDYDTLNGGIFTPLQAQVLQNEISVIAEQILALEYHPEHPEIFLQNDAALKGQLQAFRFLLQRSEENQQLLLRAAQSNLPI